MPEFLQRSDNITSGQQTDLDARVTTLEGLAKVTGIVVSGLNATGQIYVTGAGGINVSYTGKLITISGDNTSYYSNTNPQQFTNSGNLHNTGSALDARLVTQERLPTVTRIITTGLNATGQIYLTGLGSIQIAYTGKIISISGDTTSYYSISNPQQFSNSGNLYNTGSALDARLVTQETLPKVTSIIVSGLNATGQIYITGLGGINVAYTGKLITISGSSVGGGYPNDNPQQFANSGNLSATGSGLDARLVTQETLPKVTSLVVTGLNATGQIYLTGLGGIAIAYTGRLITISGDTTTYYNNSNPQQFANSGNLHNTGVALINNAFFVKTSGNQNISGVKTFVNKTVHSGRLGIYNSSELSDDANPQFDLDVGGTGLFVGRPLNVTSGVYTNLILGASRVFYPNGSEREFRFQSASDGGDYRGYFVYNGRASGTFGIDERWIQGHYGKLKAMTFGNQGMVWYWNTGILFDSGVNVDVTSHIDRVFTMDDSGYASFGKNAPSHRFGVEYNSSIGPFLDNVYNLGSTAYRFAGAHIVSVTGNEFTSGTTKLADVLYPRSNPYNFVTSGNLHSSGSALDARLVTLETLPKVTSIVVTGLNATGEVRFAGLGGIEIAYTGKFITISGSSAGSGYPNDNPQQFANSGNLHNTGSALDVRLVTQERLPTVTGIVVTGLNATGEVRFAGLGGINIAYTGKLITISGDTTTYYPNSNPQQFVNTGNLSAYYLNSNPQQFANTGNLSSYYLNSNPQQFANSGNLHASGSSLDDRLNRIILKVQVFS